jgi:polysaccharide deacetylase family protein (PEP-CTERM system associated)
MGSIGWHGARKRMDEQKTQNILSIDLEDWHQLVRRRLQGNPGKPSANVDRQLQRLLGLLDEHSTKATFFTVGMLAEARPDLVRQVAALGHEIGSHGHLHRRVYQMSQGQFEADAKKSKSLLEDITGEKICGYRAAEFSIKRDALWALEILAQVGFEYDSSIFPIRHRRYGIPDFDPKPKRYRFDSGTSIVEVPLATVRRGGQNLPFAGGGYFRLLPLSILVRNFERLNTKRVPVTTYFHPYEFDSERLDAFEGIGKTTLKQRVTGIRLNWHQNLGRDTVHGKLAELLRKFRFTTFREYLQGADLGDGTAILRATSR